MYSIFHRSDGGDSRAFDIFIYSGEFAMSCCLTLKVLVTHCTAQQGSSWALTVGRSDFYNSLPANVI